MKTRPKVEQNTKTTSKKGSNKIEAFLLRIWQEDLNTSKLKISLKRLVRIFVVSGSKFKKDKCLLWTSAISYSAVVSFVPTIIAVLMFGAAFVNIDDIFRTISEQALKLGLEIEINSYKEPIKLFLATAAKVIGGIGIFIMLWSATNVFRNLEGAFNYIFKVKNTRPIAFKIAQFVMALLLGPAALIAAITITSSMLDSFRAPDLHKLIVSKEKVWAIGTKGYIAYVDKKDKKGNAIFNRLKPLKNLDYKGQDALWLWNKEENRVANFDERKSLQISSITKIQLKDRTLTGMAQVGKQIWLVYDSGVVLRTKGKGWYMGKFALLNKKNIGSGQNSYSSQELKISGVYIFNGRVFLTGKNGYILISNNFGNTWRLVKSNQNKKEIYQITKDKKNNLWAVGEDNLLLKSDDNGEKWKYIKTTDKNLKLGNHYSYYSIFSSNNSLYIGAGNSNILISHNNGKTWTSRKVLNMSSEAVDIYGIYFKNRKQGIAIGNKHFARYTNDSGKHWHPIKRDNSWRFTSGVYHPKFGLLISGPKSKILSINTKGELPKMNLLMREKRSISFIGNALNFLATFSVIWLLFLIAYIWLPYTKVSFKAASYGAAFTSIVWVAFIFIFTFYVNNLAGKTMAIYGALAAIPLGLLMVYSSMAIILFGAELAFTMQYPSSYLRPASSIKKEEKIDYVWYGFILLYTIYKQHNSGKGSALKGTLLKIVNNDADEFTRLINLFITNKWIKEDTEEESYLALLPAHLLKLENIFDEIHNKSLDIPHYSDKNGFMKKMKPIFAKIANSRKDFLKNKTMADYLLESK